MTGQTLSLIMVGFFTHLRKLKFKYVAKTSSSQSNCWWLTCLSSICLINDWVLSFEQIFSQLKLKNSHYITNFVTKFCPFWMFFIDQIIVSPSFFLVDYPPCFVAMTRTNNNEILHHKQSLPTSKQSSLSRPEIHIITVHVTCIWYDKTRTRNETNIETSTGTRVPITVVIV